MFSLQKTRTEDVSPRRAQEILARMNTFEGQRQMRQKHAANLGAAIASGSLIKGSVAFAENCKLGSKVLVNGQHTLQGIVLADKTITCTIDDYTYENPDDLWRLFGTFDIGKSRSEHDVMRAAQGLFKSPVLQAIPLRCLSVCGSALLYLGDGVKPDFTSGKNSGVKTLKPDLVQKYEDEVCFVRDLYIDLNDDPKVLTCTPIIACYRIHEEKARDFWSRILSGADLAKNSPEWNLAKAISKEASIAVRAGLAKGGAGRGKYGQMWNLCIAWWNTFITGQKRVIVKLSSIKGIMEIAGPKG